VALILLDRVKVNTTTTGTGTVVLANTAPTGYQTFAVIGNANTTYYTIAGQTSAEWEVGIGTYYLANSSLSRDTILSSSAANAAVTFGVGTKDVFVTYPAERAIYADSSNITTITNFASANVLITGGKVNSAALTGGSINNMTIGATTANTGAFTTITSTGNVNLDAGTFFVDATNNLVGVNTSSPASGLASVMNFGNAASTNFLAQANGTAISQTAGYSFRSTFGNTADFAPRRSADVWSGYNAGNWGTEYLAFGVGNNGASNDTSTLTAEKMRITSAGYVGIGTTAPAVTLDVQAASNAVLYARIYNANTNSATQTQLQINTGGKYTALTVSYAGNYFFNQGLGGIVTSYTDYDTQAFRNNAGAAQLYVASTASANNYAQITGGLGVGPTISAAGADTNIDIKLTPKGTGYANITSGGVKFPDGTTQATAALTGNSSILINNINVTANATIAANTNGFSVGPINTANGVSVTIASGSRWVVI
jgi:hypothetical protein